LAETLDRFERTRTYSISGVEITRNTKIVLNAPNASEHGHYTPPGTL
jgi:hypothetical protein